MGSSWKTKVRATAKSSNEYVWLGSSCGERLGRPAARDKSESKGSESTRNVSLSVISFDCWRRKPIPESDTRQSWRLVDFWIAMAGLGRLSREPQALRLFI